MPLLPPFSKPVPATTHAEADRVYGLVRSGRDVNEWTDDEKVAFVNATHLARPFTGEFTIDKALEPLDDAKIRRLLRQLMDEDEECARKWHSCENSMMAILSGDVTIEELTSVRDVFGFDEWLKFVFDARPKSTVYHDVLCSAFLPLTFPEDIVPLKYFQKTLQVWGENKTNRQLYDIVVKSAKHHLTNGGPLGMNIVENTVFRIVADYGGARIGRPYHPAPDTEIISCSLLLRSIYSDTGLVPSTDAWITLLFTQAQSVCNNFLEYDTDEDEDYTVEMSFCELCEDYAVGNGPDSPVPACGCEDRLHPDDCLFLMQKNVPIPNDFWLRCAYHNQWRLAHFLHVRKPESFELNIPASAFRKAIEYNRLGFVKFLVQYGYFTRSDVPLGADLSTEMREYLGVAGKRKRWQDALASTQAALDELKQDMPENTYLRLCARFQEAFNQ